jgi:hypothetical protein
MKTSLIILLFAFNALANITVNEVKLIEGFATNYELTSKSHNKKINLDCQSFFHKFDIYNDSQLISERYITESECKVLETKVNVCLKEKQKVCFNEDDIYQSSCKCD